MYVFFLNYFLNNSIILDSRTGMTSILKKNDREKYNLKLQENNFTNLVCFNPQKRYNYIIIQKVCFLLRLS